MEKFTKKMEAESIRSFAEAVHKIKDVDATTEFFKEIFTASELNTLALRWRLLELLNEGHSQRNISAALGISLCKITRGSKILHKRKSATKELIKK
ncbi:TrpR family transcriptional regulator [Parelusimicrobium proximum]|uniref:Trp family transcriptional regulator n=1 Tax=Parelusimicrobium proximum TaxID=3228953 RepID=UPI003D17BBED